jgi:VIT1/CCC1 family predicted Fe2+/Mn2+ transporter
MLYSIKISMTVVLIGPVLTGFVLILTDPDVYQAKDILIAWLYSPVAAILCIPSWFLLGLTVNKLTKKHIKIRAAKIVLTFLGIIYILIPFTLLDYHAIVHSNY